MECPFFLISFAQTFHCLLPACRAVHILATICAADKRFTALQETLKTAVGQVGDSQQPQQNHTCATTMPSTRTLSTLPLPERPQPALSVSNTSKRCFLGNPRDALVVSCAVLYNRQYDYFLMATCASRVWQSRN